MIWKSVVVCSVAVTIFGGGYFFNESLNSDYIKELENRVDAQGVTLDTCHVFTGASERYFDQCLQALEQVSKDEDACMRHLKKVLTTP